MRANDTAIYNTAQVLTNYDFFDTALYQCGFSAV